MNINKLRDNKMLAHIVPLFSFLIILALLQFITSVLLKGYFRPHSYLPWWRSNPEHWIYPIQTVATLFLLIFWRKHYTFNISIRATFLGIILGIIGISFWLLPTQIYEWAGYTADNPPSEWLSKLGIQKRENGFDPRIFGLSQEEFDHFGDYISLLLRFLRAVVIVALIEEIFWRGFLMRFLLNPDGNYWNISFGKAHIKSYLIVTAGFMIAHSPVDYLGAFFYGSVMYFTATYTKSLWACVINHGIANLIMGIYALQTGKYGLW